MTISPEGLDFVVRHEGYVSTAYRDPVGVWTIGSGFTNGSGVAVELLGRIGPGKTITRAQNDRVLAAAFAREYGPPVDRAMPGARQYELDAGYSYSFNCGPAAMGDSWVELWRNGQTFEAGERLKISRVTARGKPLKGLRNRRASEARLLTTGDYGAGVRARDDPDDYRSRIAALGYSSVIAFQRHHPHLVNDDILGPATRAQVDRDIAARREGKGAGAGVAVGVGLAAWLATTGSTLLAVAVVAGVVGLVAWFVLRRREEITHWINEKRKG